MATLCVDRLPTVLGKCFKSRYFFQSIGKDKHQRPVPLVVNCHCQSFDVGREMGLNAWGKDTIKDQMVWRLCC